MKTTIELPDALAREVKLLAVREGRKLKDVIAELLRKGLDAATPPAENAVVRDERSGLLVVACRHPAPRRRELTPERVADILLEQEADWHRDAGAPG